MYKDMVSLLSPVSSGKYSIEYFDISSNDIRAMLDGIPIGKYVGLYGPDGIIMSDTPMEKRTNMEFCVDAHGDVLIGGLGIGMIVMAIQDEEKIRSITVLEREQAVIDMITAQLPFNDKVHIVHADVYEWQSQDDQMYDCIYIDIWNYVNRTVFKNEMVPLMRKYETYLKHSSDSPQKFIRCWAQWNAENGVRL